MTLFEQLQQQVKELLSTSAGCPWMLQQNWRSIAQYSLEEVYELMDAIVRDDKPAVCDELADLCLHLLIYPRIVLVNKKRRIVRFCFCYTNKTT